MQETERLEHAFWCACDGVGVRKSDQATMRSLLAPLRDKSEVTHVHYLHSLRVALKATAIAAFQHMEEKPLLFAGALHDIGKVQVPLEVLGRVEGWSKSDQATIESHVLDGFRMLKGRFDFSASIMLWHHRFQPNSYPKLIPKELHPYSNATSLLIAESGRMLALADVYDALHRPNGKHGKALDPDEVKQKMLEYNPDRRKLVLALYSAGILG